LKVLDTHAMMQNDRILARIKNLKSIASKPVLHGAELQTVLSSSLDWKAAVKMDDMVSRILKDFDNKIRKDRGLASVKVRDYRRDLAGIEENFKKAQKDTALLGQALKPLLVALDTGSTDGRELRSILCSEDHRGGNCL
jgi:hypothetical protein